LSESVLALSPRSAAGHAIAWDDAPRSGVVS